MRRVYKYFAAAPGETVVRLMPIGWKPLSVQMQADDICIWAEVDSEAKLEQVAIHTIGTGWNIPDGANYLGTVQERSLVWHVYSEAA